MSFRNRLTLFFVAIVIVPMVSVAFVLFSLISDNEKGKADAALRARQQTAVNLYTAARQAADKLAPQVGDRRARWPRALRDGDDAAAERRARELRRELGLVRLQIADRRGARVDVGSKNAVAHGARGRSRTRRGGSSGACSCRTAARRCSCARSSGSPGSTRVVRGTERGRGVDARRRRRRARCRGSAR